MTNLLLEAGRQAASGDRGGMATTVQAIVDKHTAMLEGLPEGADRKDTEIRVGDLHTALELTLADVALAGELTAKNSDRIVSTGEKAMSVLMAATLRSRGYPAEAVFADRVIATDARYGSARPDRERTREQADAVVRPLLDEGKTVVMTGFIGGAPDGSTTTLGRGGSDYSATLLGAALDADEVQIWTDVPGVLSADPRQVPDARVVPQLGFDEAQELAHFGAKVLHPRTIRPAVALDIPVRILSTFAPHEPGTLVTRESSGDYLKAVTAMKNLILLTVDVPELEDLSGAAVGGLRRALRGPHRSRAGRAGIQPPPDDLSHRRRRTTAGATGSAPASKTCCASGNSRSRSAAPKMSPCWPRSGRARPISRARWRACSACCSARAVPVLAANQQISNVAMVAAVPEKLADRGLLAIHDEFIGSRPSGAKLRRQRRSRLMAESVHVG